MEQNEEKYFHYENIGKNIFTTLIGFIFMMLSIAGIIVNWFFSKQFTQIEWPYIIGALVIGIVLLFCRDNIRVYADLIIRKKIDNVK